MYRTEKEKTQDKDGGIIIARQTLKKPYCVIDTETTGVIEDYDQACQYAILYSDTEYFKTLLKPTIHISEEASCVNNIFDKDVVNAPPATDTGIIGKIPYMTLVLGWNVKFDINILRNSGRARGSNAMDRIESENEIVDIEWVYSKFIGYWNKDCNRFGKKALEEACKKCGIDIDLPLHDALSDCIMIERLLKYIASQKLSTE